MEFKHWQVRPIERLGLRVGVMVELNKIVSVCFRCINVLRLEQLKLYEVLVSHSRHQLLVHESFLRPLLKLLSSCANEVFPIEVEKGLVILLNQLCVSLMHNDELLDLFFFTSHNQGPAK